MRKALVFGIFLAIMMFAVHALTAEAAVDAKSGIAGTVTWRAEPGSMLAAGAEIVRVRTLTGEVAAARAEENCSVSEMLVSVGDDIAAGQVVARLKKQDE